MPHTVQFKDKLWARIVRVSGLSEEEHPHAIHDLIREVITEWVTLKEQRQRSEATSVIKQPNLSVRSPALAPATAPAPRKQLSIMWPLPEDVEHLLLHLNYNPAILKPRSLTEPVSFRPPQDDDPDEELHLEQKKYIIADGFRFQGMDNPDASLDYALSDIEEKRPWSSLNDRAKAAHRAAISKYRQWKVKQLATTSRPNDVNRPGTP
jgi:hypothetical protein